MQLVLYYTVILLTMCTYIVNEVIYISVLPHAHTTLALHNPGDAPIALTTFLRWKFDANDGNRQQNDIK